MIASECSLRDATSPRKGGLVGRPYGKTKTGYKCPAKENASFRLL